MDQSNYGSHFLIGFTQQLLRKNRRGFNEISITAQCDARITITSLMSKNPLQMISLKAGKVFNFKVSSSFRMNGTGVDNKGVQIQSTANIAVIGINYVRGSSDAFLALPTSALGKTYVVSTRLNLGYGRSLKLSNFGVISQRDGTKVSITLKTNGIVSYLDSKYGVGETFTVTLNKLETFHLTHGYDLSGTIINSNYPVAVLSGSPCENVGKSGYCDHLVSYLLPVEKWGKEYILVPAMKSATSGDFYRVFASQTTLVRSRHVTRMIYRGDFLEIGPCHNELSSFVLCSKPCQVVQYVRPYEPSSIVLPSTKQFATSYKVVPMAILNYTHHIIIIIEEQHRGSLMVDEQSTTQFNWKNVKGTKYVWATYNMTRATDIESSNNVKFGVIVSGHRHPASYGYPAGFAFT